MFIEFYNLVYIKNERDRKHKYFKRYFEILGIVCKSINFIVSNAVVDATTIEQILWFGGFSLRGRP